MIRGKKDFWAGLIYMFFGFGAMILARDYPIGTAVKMGPSYFPTILGGILVFIGILSLIRSFIQGGTPISGITLRGMAMVALSTVLFGLLARRAGLIVALPLLVLVSALGGKGMRWIPMLLLAAALTLFCALVFIKGLGIPLPIIGPWLGG
jgi:putative tricarboxylic transport membrane protein